MYRGIQVKLVMVAVLSMVVILLVGLAACAAPTVTPAPQPPAQPAPKYTVAISVDPTTVSLAMNEKIKMPTPVITPITFVGAGWKPGELVLIELVGAAKSGGDLPIASGATDDNGTFKMRAETMSIIHGVCGGKMVNMAPVFDPYQPIAAKVYTAKVTGLESRAEASTSLGFTNP